jgi:hypothetical protein
MLLVLQKEDALPQEVVLLEEVAPPKEDAVLDEVVLAHL